MYYQTQAECKLEPCFIYRKPVLNQSQTPHGSIRSGPYNPKHKTKTISRVTMGTGKGIKELENYSYSFSITALNGDVFKLCLSATKWF